MYLQRLFIILILALFGGCIDVENEDVQKETVDGKSLEKATFAAGCFLYTEADYERMNGVVDVILGYTGGQKENPTYEEVSSGTTGHCEAVQITYDPSNITYRELVDALWIRIDPTDSEGQYTYRGPQYRTAIFYHTEAQKRAAQDSKEELEKSGEFDKPIVTEILPASEFYKAEENHSENCSAGWTIRVTKRFY